MARPAYGNGDPEDAVIYAVDAQAMRERLDAMGYTVSNARAEYALGLKEEYETYLGAGFSVAERRRVREWTYDRWCGAVARLVPLGFQVLNAEQFSKDSDAERVADDMRSGVGSFFSDPRFLMRGLLDALQNASEVILDVPT